MILEAIVTTRNADGSPNIAPMGPHCADADMQTFELRPFQSSTTWQNLNRSGQGVLHVTDDVLLFAQAATRSKLEASLRPAEKVQCDLLGDCCRCYEFEAVWIDETQERAVVQCRTLHSYRFRDFFGYNRARHAVIEASILATRIDFLPPEEILGQFTDLERLVVKTGGAREYEAFELLKQFLSRNNVVALTDSNPAP